METVKGHPAQPTAGALIAQLARLGAATTWRHLRAAATTHRNVSAAVAGGLALGVLNERLPAPVALLGDAIGAGALWHWGIAPRLRTGLTRRERKVQGWLDDVCDTAGIIPAPVIRRDGRRLAVRVSRHSWTIDLDVMTGGEKQIRSAAEFCAMWPRLKTQMGEGCIGVYLHELRGRHVRMVIVWEQEQGDRVVLIAPGRAVLVLPSPRGGYRTWNPSLRGYVLPEHAHAQEHYPRPGDETAAVTFDDDEHEASVALEDADELPEPDDDDDTPEPHDDEESLPTWLTEEAVQAPPGGVNGSGRGEEATTPPDPFSQPPQGPSYNLNMFVPTTYWQPHERPLDAPDGTRTGLLWDTLADGRPHDRNELAELCGMTVASVGNKLTGWARLGLVDAQPDGWQMTNAAIAQHLG